MGSGAIAPLFLQLSNAALKTLDLKLTLDIKLFLVDYLHEENT